MQYFLSYEDPNSHYLDISYVIPNVETQQLVVQLPAWRPGRYELGNFAKNIQKWQAYDENGQPLAAKKMTKDSWQIECGASQEVTIKYNYYAFELNAGSTFLDADQLYVNGVNCLLYVPNRMQEACDLYVSLPEEYALACALSGSTKFHLQAKDFDELVDSPFIASAQLKHHAFTEGGVQFHLWFQGECKPDFLQLEKDFRAFAASQLQLFGELPISDYHFLYQITPYRSYHGVEHADSTVCLLGPSHALMKKEGMYDELLGVSSHELFHAWNVKRIRPTEMVPYDFSKENYSRLGYLAEGATTYYGDLMLLRSKVFDDASYFKTFNQLLFRHFNNPGSLNLSVADSSFDTWLDGYVAGVPNRKSSIYTEGALITFMLDIIIRKNTDQQASFDDVMRTFYQDYYQKGIGVSEEAYQAAVEQVAGKSLTSFFDDYVNGAKDFSMLLKECLAYIGLQYTGKATSQYHESHWGVRLSPKTDGKVLAVYPDSPAAIAGLSVGDQLLSINDYPYGEDFSDWCQYFAGEEVMPSHKSVQGAIDQVFIKADGKSYYQSYVLAHMETKNASQEAAYEAWSWKTDEMATAPLS